MKASSGIILRFAVNVWCFPRETSIEKMAEWVRSAGYDGIEVAISEKDLEVEKPAERWGKVKEILDSHNLVVPSVATGLYRRYNMALGDEKLIEGAIKLTKLMCEVATTLEAKVILVVPGVAVPEIPYEKLIDNMVGAIKRIAAVAKDYDIILGVENVWNRLLAGPLEFRWFLDRVSEENVKAYFDIGNTLPHSLPEHWIRVLGKDIAMLHAKDFDLRELRFRPILQGSINWEEVAKALREVSYDWFLAIEIAPYPGHPYKMIFDVKSALDLIFSR